jgi:hypothetical protein
MNPGAIEEGAKVAGSIIEGLKREPVSLALVALNLLFMLVFYGVFREISASAQRRDALLSELAKSCILPRPN